MKNIFLIPVGIVIIFLFSGVSESLAYDIQQPAVEKLSQQSTQVAFDSLAELRHYKAELLLKEFDLRHQHLQNQENIFLILRIVLMIILIGFSLIAYVKAKSSQELISRLVIFSLIVILLAVYWYDQFILDQHGRVLYRVGEIPYDLNRIPTLTGDELRSLKLFEVLTWPVGLGPKISLFFRAPNFEQLISYGPIVIVIILLIYRSITLKRGKVS